MKNKNKMSQQEKEIHKLSSNFRIRNKIISKIVYRLYNKPIKLHNQTEEQIWNKILNLDKEKKLFIGERKMKNKNKMEEEEINLCPKCHCMTKTIKGKCGKCGYEKEEKQ